MGGAGDGGPQQLLGHKKYGIIKAICEKIPAKVLQDIRSSSSSTTSP